MTNTSPDAISNLSRTVATALSATETPESMGRALYRHLLTHGPEQGKVSADGRSIEMQVAARLSVPAAGGADPTERKVRVQLCVSAFGYDIACVGSVIDDGNPT